VLHKLNLALNWDTRKGRRIGGKATHDDSRREQKCYDMVHEQNCDDDTASDPDRLHALGAQRHRAAVQAARIEAAQK
jgi:hypothetical protein